MRMSVRLGVERNVLVVQLLSCVRLFAAPGTVACHSTVHGTSQARILDWVAISFSRVSSQPRNRTQVSCFAGRLLHCRQILYQLNCKWSLNHGSYKLVFKSNHHITEIEHNNGKPGLWNPGIYTISTPRLTLWLSLSRSQSFSASQFPSPENRANNSTCI